MEINRYDQMNVDRLHFTTIEHDIKFFEIITLKSLQNDSDQHTLETKNKMSLKNSIENCCFYSEQYYTF